MRLRLHVLGMIGLCLATGLLGGCEIVRPNCPACSSPTPFASSCPYRESSVDGFADPELLFLSGGGSHGAWGAGVLHQWKNRPVFDVVTGVSTGALQAPLVFLDSTSADAKLKKLYTESENDDIYTNKLWFAFSNSIQSREPLKELIDSNLPDTEIDLIAAKTGRELWVGTVNMDTSEFCPWNLSTIASKAKAATGTPKGDCFYDLFRDVIWAASGAPVVAPPVAIDGGYCEDIGKTPPPTKNGALHVDGGVRLRVFGDRFFTPGNGITGTTTAYVVMNGKLALHEQCVVNSFIPITMRTLEIQLSEGVFGNLHYMMSRPGPPLNLRLSRIPNDTCLPWGNGEFDPVKMTELFDAGAKWVAPPDNSPTDWETTVPDDRAVPWPPNCESPLKGCN